MNYYNIIIILIIILKKRTQDVIIRPPILPPVCALGPTKCFSLNAAFFFPFFFSICPILQKIEDNYG